MVFAMGCAWLKNIVSELFNGCNAGYHELRIFGDKRSNGSAFGDALDVAGDIDVKDDDGQVVFHAEGHRGQVHHFEAAGDGVGSRRCGRT